MTNRQTSKAGALEVIRSIVARQGRVTAGEVARAMGVTRQAAFYHLSRLAGAGELILVGRGRGAHYRAAARFVRRYPLDGLQEDKVWKEVSTAVEDLSQARPNVRSIMSYALTEMVNNSIDHSGGAQVAVTFWSLPDRFTFEVVDDGVGAFRHARERLGLEDDLAALQHLSKGKQTTDPARHTGQGIFFTSKVVDTFLLEANGLRWIVDNMVEDHAIGRGLIGPGTRVRCEVLMGSTRTTREVFDRFSTPESYEFDRSRVSVRLFEGGRVFVSRSEAKRLASGLEQFREVELDFSGVEEVGQGFVDELFRVWARQHPETALIPVGMAEPVRRMVEVVVSAG